MLGEAGEPGAMGQRCGMMLDSRKGRKDVPSPGCCRRALWIQCVSATEIDLSPFWKKEVKVTMAEFWSGTFFLVVNHHGILMGQKEQSALWGPFDKALLPILEGTTFLT